MFGIGFTEILLISIIAILFLGPDKLPEALVQIAKFVKSVKKTIGEAKSSLDEELRIADLKEEALSYKKQLDSTSSELRGFKNIGLDDMNDILSHSETKAPQTPDNASPHTDAEEKHDTEVEMKSETVTFKKKSKKKKKSDAADTDKKAKKSKKDTTEGNA